MMTAKLRATLYFTLYALRGQHVGAYYQRMLREVRDGIAPDTTSRHLAGLLAYCQAQVPYYAEIMRDAGGSFHEDPETYLMRLPLLTKDIIRARLEDLRSKDLPKRKWHFNTSGGSTGEPVRFIQDREFDARSGAIKLLFSKLVGREIGEPEYMLWRSHRDLAEAAKRRRAEVLVRLSNITMLDGVVMTPAKMREYIALLNRARPQLISGYSDAVYELAKFAEEEGLAITPQAAVMSAGGALFPFMREKIETVFQCKVYNRYGSREVGDVACERPGWTGLWVAPWGNYVEIVDEEGRRVPDGCEGTVVVTSLSNFGMPLVRYVIGDRGALLPLQPKGCQVLEGISGRATDLFRAKNGQLIQATHFMMMLFFRDWLRKYQVVQKSPSRVLFRLVCPSPDHPQSELDDLTAKTRLVMGDDCEVDFEFVDDIPATPSGKFRYVVSEVQGS